MAKTKQTPKKTASKKVVSRRLKTGNYKSFRLQKRISHIRPRVSGSFRIFRDASKLLIHNWKIFGGIILVYLVLDIILVKGFGSSTNIPQLKRSLLSIFGNSKGQISTGVTLFGLLLGSAGNAPTQLAGAYQSILLVIMSLALVWTLRQVMASEKIRLREAFYKSTYPLVPFLLVLLVIGLQLIPLVIANFLYGIVFTQGLAVTGLEKVLWGVLLSLLVLLSLYMVCSSVFALYIVTLPDMSPMQALRSARELVRFRRWTIMRKVLFLPLALLLVAAVVTIPTILYISAAAEWVFFVLTMLALPFIHAYMYTLYRELL